MEEGRGYACCNLAKITAHGFVRIFGLGCAHPCCCVMSDWRAMSVQKWTLIASRAVKRSIAELAANHFALR